MKKSTPILALSAILILFFALASCKAKQGGGTSRLSPLVTTCTFVSGKTDLKINSPGDITFVFDQTAGTITILDTGKCITTIPQGTTRSWYTYKDASSKLHFVDSPSVRTLIVGNTFRWPLSSTIPASFTMGTEGTGPACAVGIGDGNIRNAFKCKGNEAPVHCNINNSGNDNIPNYVTANVTKVDSALIFFLSASGWPNTGTAPPDDAGTCPVSATIICH